MSGYAAHANALAESICSIYCYVTQPHIVIRNQIVRPRTIAISELLNSSGLSQAQADKIQSQQEMAATPHLGGLLAGLPLDLRTGGVSEQWKPPRWARIEDAAHILGIKVKTLRRRCQTSRVPKKIDRSGRTWILASY